MIVGEDSIQYRKRKKHCFLTAAILLFIGKIIITWYPPKFLWKIKLGLFKIYRLSIKI